MTAHRVTRAFAWNHLYKIVEYGGVNLYAILVVRKFGPAIGGNYAVFLSLCSTLAIIGAFAVDGVPLRYIPRILRGERNYGEKKIEGLRPFLIELLAFRLLVNLVLAAFIVVVLAILPNYFPQFANSLGNIRTMWPYLVLYLFAQGGVAFSVYTLIGMLQVKGIFYASLITRSALLLAGLLVLNFGNFTLERAISLFTFSAVLNASILLVLINKHIESESSEGLRAEFAYLRRRLSEFIRKPSSIRVFLLLPMMLYGVTTWGNDVLSTVLGRQPDFLMMRALLGENARDIGLYYTAAQLAIMTEYIALFGLGGTLVSVFSELAHEDERNPLASSGVKKTKFHYPRLNKARQDIFGYQTVATGPFFAYMITFSPLILSVVYGPQFPDAQPMLLASLIIQAITVLCFGGGMHITSLVAIGKERVVFVNRLSWGILNLIANYFLIRSMGGLGAMIGTQLSNAGACATEYILTTRWIGQSIQPGRSITILSVIALSTLISYYGLKLLPSGLPLLATFAISGIAMGIFTASGYMLFQIPEAHTVFRKLRSLIGSSDGATIPSNG